MMTNQHDNTISNLDCEICGGTNRIRVPRLQRLSSYASQSDRSDIIANAYAKYPCPECASEVDTCTVSFLKGQERARSEEFIGPDDGPEYKNYVERSIALNMVDRLVREGMVTFEWGKKDKLDLTRMVTATIGVVSPNQVATHEERATMRGMTLAADVVQEAIKQINNWGSDYNAKGISKDRACKYLQESYTKIFNEVKP